MAVAAQRTGRSRGKILVVDDSALALKVARKRLERAGFEVVTRQEALGTCRAILHEKPDLVLLDLKMPTLAGDIVIDLVLKRRQIPVIFHSSASSEVLARTVRTTGAVGAIEKTQSDAAFLAQFEMLLRRARVGYDTCVGLQPRPAAI